MEEIKIKKILVVFILVCIILSLVSCKTINGDHNSNISSDPLASNTLSLPIGLENSTETTDSQKTDSSSEEIKLPVNNKNNNSITTIIPSSAEHGNENLTQSSTPTQEAASPAEPSPKPENPDAKPYDEKDIYRTDYNIGSNRNLTGALNVHCFFVDDDESSWSKDEINSFYQNQISPALEFIVTQAGRYDIPLNFDAKLYHTTLTEYSTKYNGIVNKNLREGGSTKDVFDQISVSMGFLSGDDMATKNQGDHPRVDKDIYLLFLNKNGVSYTRNIICDGILENYDSHKSEHCIIFAHDLDYMLPSIFKEARSSTIAHEIMHLFGAQDYYLTQQRLDLASKYYYNDIMVLNTRSMQQLEIMDMTAFSIGWIHTVPEVCYIDDWWED